jgi:hypothetical protein
MAAPPDNIKHAKPQGTLISLSEIITKEDRHLDWQLPLSED